MRILHMLWLPFAYWFFPYKLANNALRGTLKHYGIDISTIPVALTEEIAKKTIDTQKLTVKRNSISKKLYDLQLTTDHNAITIKKLIKGEYKFAFEKTEEVLYIEKFLTKHGVKTV